MTLTEALAHTYTHNPQLEAAREGLHATDETMAQAVSNFRPDLAIVGGAGHRKSESTGGFFNSDESLNSRSVALELNQPLYRGGRTTAEMAVAENTIKSTRASLIQTEQDILLAAIASYMDVFRDEATVELETQNEQILMARLEETQARFDAGELTRTDVSQAASRLALAQARLQRAESLLVQSMALFEQIVGLPPTDIQSAPDMPKLPTTIDQAIDMALENNPQILSLEFEAQAAKEQVGLVTGELLPEVSLNGELSRSWDQAFEGDEGEAAAVMARVRIPIYQAGRVTSRRRQASRLSAQKQQQLDATERQVQQLTLQTWSQMLADRAEIDAYIRQIKAARLSLDGVEAEADAGDRTFLDVLNAQQELLNAKLALLQSRRNEVVSSYQVLAATGQLTARQLALPVHYFDMEKYYREHKNTWWSLD